MPENVAFADQRAVAFVKRQDERIAELEAENARLRMKNGYLATGLEGERAVMQSMSTDIMAYIGRSQVPSVAVLKGWSAELASAAHRADEATADSSMLPDKTLADNARLRDALASARDEARLIQETAKSWEVAVAMLNGLAAAADAALAKSDD